MSGDEENLTNFLGARLVKQLDLGVGGNLYGGRMLDFVAEHGAIYAAKCTGEAYLVGYRFTEFFLTRPVKPGEILDFYAGEPKFGQSSVSFTICGRVNGELAVRGECTFVAINADGGKKRLNPEKI